MFNDHCWFYVEIFELYEETSLAGVQLKMVAKKSQMQATNEQNDE